MSKCCRPTAGMLQRCCRSAAALRERCCIISHRSYISNSKFLGQVNVLERSRPAAEMLQTCRRDAADLLLPSRRGAAEVPVDATYQI